MELATGRLAGQRSGRNGGVRFSLGLLGLLLLAAGLAWSLACGFGFLLALSLSDLPIRQPGLLLVWALAPGLLIIVSGACVIAGAALRRAKLYGVASACFFIGCAI